MNDLTSLIETPIDKLLSKMILIPIGAVEKTNVLVLRSILGRVLPGSQKSLKKGDAVIKWGELCDDYQANLTAVFSATTTATRQRLTDAVMQRMIEYPLEMMIQAIQDNFYGLAVSTVASELSWVRKFLAANPDFPNARDLAAWSTAYGKPINAAKNKGTDENLREKLQVVKKLKESLVSDWVQSHKNSSSWQDISIIIAICTGRRMIEIHGDATFEPVDEKTIFFTGQAKKRYTVREAGEDGYNIPVIYLSAQEISALVQKLENMGKRIENPDRIIVNKTFSMPLSRHPSPLTQYKEARDYYAAYLVHNGYAGDSLEALYITKVLGHKPGDTGVSGSALNYQKLRLV